MQETYGPHSDWHAHTHLSDGRASPAEAARAALDLGLRHLAITDHDCIDAHLDEQLGGLVAGTGLELIAGVEIDCTLEDLSIEILGYRFDPHDRVLGRRLREIQIARRERVRFLAEGLARSGEPVDPEALLAGETVAFLKVHLYKVLEAAGRTFAGGYREFKDQLAELGSPPSVPTPTAEEAVRLICDAGGYALLAHPLYYLQRRDPRWLLTGIRAAGCLGVEFAYPYDYGSDGLARDEVAEAYGRLREALVEVFPSGALRSRGSDVHDPAEWRGRLERVAEWEQALASGAGRPPG